MRLKKAVNRSISVLLAMSILLLTVIYPENLTVYASHTEKYRAEAYGRETDSSGSPDYENCGSTEDLSVSEEVYQPADNLGSVLGNWEISTDRFIVKYKSEKGRKSFFNVVPAWDYSRGEGAVVAVIDTGIDIEHEDIEENIWTNTAEIAGNGIDDDGDGYIDDIHGWDFCEEDNSVHDSSRASGERHGTHVAGIMAAEKDNGRGIAGVAPRVEIMPLRVFNGDTAHTSDIIEAIDY